MKIFITTIIIILLLTGCSTIKDSNGNISFPNPTADNDDKVDNKIKEIVEAFDNRDSKKIKSLLHKSVIEENPNIDDDINKLLDFYKGKSIEYERQSNESTIVKDGNVQYVCYADIQVKTEFDEYLIRISYNVMDRKNPQNEGIYAIGILPQIFHKYYYNTPDDLNVINEMESRLPDMVFGGDAAKGYLEYGKKVFVYSLNDIKEAYYKKNGTEMILHEGMSEEETKN